MKSLKLKSYPGENVTDFCAEILLDAVRLESSGAFKPEHLGYITRIFEDTSDSRFFSVGYSVVQGGYGVYQETLCV